MKTLDRQKLDFVNQTRSNPALGDWRGQFTPDFKPIEFERFGNCREFATIGSRTCPVCPLFTPVEFDGFENLGNRQFIRLNT